MSSSSGSSSSSSSVSSSSSSVSSSSVSSSSTSSSSANYFSYNLLSTGKPVGNSIKWRSIVAGADGKLYCAPYADNSILVIDPADDSVSTVSLSSLYVYSGSGQKWVDGLLAPNGKMYFNPHKGGGWLILDTSSGRLVATNIGGPNQTRGGAIDTNGVIHSTQFSGSPPLKHVFRLDTNTDTTLEALKYTTDRTGGIYSARPNWATDVNYGTYDAKWGVTAAANGKLYSTPFSASRILITDPVTGLSSEGADALTGNAPLPTELAFPSPIAGHQPPPPFFAKYSGGTWTPCLATFTRCPEGRTRS